MWKYLFLLSAIPIAATLAARWYFGLRVLATEGGRACRCDPNRWTADPAATTAVSPVEQSAHEFGKALRLRALAEWKELDPKALASRESSKRFGMAVPPLSALVAIFAVIVAKIPIMGAITIVLAATALACAVGIMSMTPELSAITRAAKKLRESRGFPRRDDEEATIRCAMAHAWAETIPPILAKLQR